MPKKKDEPKNIPINVVKPEPKEPPEPKIPKPNPKIGHCTVCTVRYCCPPVIPKEASQKSFLGIFRELLRLRKLG